MPKLTTLKPKINTINTSSVKSLKIERLRGRPAARDRERILKRDRGLCVNCKRNGIITLAQEVDHIVPLADGGSDTDGNKQSLCIPCHQVKTKKENVSR